MRKSQFTRRRQNTGRWYPRPPVPSPPAWTDWTTKASPSRLSTFRLLLARRVFPISDKPKHRALYKVNRKKEAKWPYRKPNSTLDMHGINHNLGNICKTKILDNHWSNEVGSCQVSGLFLEACGYNDVSLKVRTVICCSFSTRVTRTTMQHWDRPRLMGYRTMSPRRRHDLCALMAI